jgi:hypothetical protein
MLIIIINLAVILSLAFSWLTKFPLNPEVTVQYFKITLDKGLHTPSRTLKNAGFVYNLNWASKRGRNNWT